jgi:hypothetical protein
MRLGLDRAVSPRSETLMDFRQGTCSSCQNSIRVSSTFQAARAKCPKCGGTVELGPVQTGSSAAAKAARPSAAAPRVGTRAGGEKSSTRTAAASGSKRAREKEHATGERARGGRTQAAKKKSRVPLIAGGLMAVAVAALAFRYFTGGSDAQAQPQAPAASVKPDLSHIPDAAKHPETSDEEWTAMNEMMAAYIKPPFDRNAERSGDLLAPKGLRAVPAILNGWKKVDLSTSEGASLGWKIQTLLLQERCGGTNFGWHRDTRLENIAFNTHVIERWFQAWSQAGDDASKWEEIAKTGTKKSSGEPAESK